MYFFSFDGAYQRQFMYVITQTALLQPYGNVADKFEYSQKARRNRLVSKKVWFYGYLNA